MQPEQWNQAAPQPYGANEYLFFYQIIQLLSPFSSYYLQDMNRSQNKQPEWLWQGWAQMCSSNPLKRRINKEEVIKR